MKILVINCGSSSLKYQLIEMDNETLLCKGLVERIGIDGSNLKHQVPNKDAFIVKKPINNHKEATKLMLDTLLDKENGVINSIDEIYAVGHRVLHGGLKFTESVIVNADVKNAIRECFDLGPLHNPANLMGIEAMEEIAQDKKNVAVFDTTFGMSMDEKSYLYAIPYEYYKKYSIRRYGFHGTSHMYVSNETIKFGNLDKNAKVIVCHLGNGASVSASIGGKCVDTSMGLTPLEGLIMGTRRGDLDPAILQYIMNKEKLSPDEMLNILNKKSGVLGLSDGISSDFRDVKKAAEEGNHMAEVAIEAFRYRVAKYIGAYTASMNGVDAISFTAGVGENDSSDRKGICEYLGYLGITIDDEANKIRGERKLISTKDSKVKVFVLPTNEELMIARETKRLI